MTLFSTPNETSRNKPGICQKIWYVVQPDVMKGFTNLIFSALEHFCIGFLSVYRTYRIWVCTPNGYLLLSAAVYTHEPTFMTNIKNSVSKGQAE